nr:nucleobase:cation symporter-2 family protein [Salinisphaera sp. Q1T1-3]
MMLGLSGLQHVLVMYAASVAVALIIGYALALPHDELAYLINADLLCAGFGTLIQSAGVACFGIRMPVIMGASFVSVGPLVAMADGGQIGLPGMFGATAVSGVFAMLIVPLFSRLLVFFPPLVTGLVITSIGLSLLPVSIRWVGGGAQAGNFAALGHLVLAGLVFVIILLINRLGRGFWVNISVLIGLASGYVAAAAFGLVNWQGLAERPWIEVITPFHFGMWTFPPAAVAALCIVMIVTLVESTGMFMALGDMVDAPVDRHRLNRGLLADGLTTAFSGLFNGFVHTSFAQNVGLVGMTGVRSRFVTVVSGGVLLALSLCPKAAFVVAAVPKAVLGGASLIMFGMIAAAGLNVMSQADLSARSNQLVVAIALAFGLMPQTVPALFAGWPDWAAPIVHSGIMLTTIAAVSSNLLLNGRHHTPKQECRHDAAGH